MHRTPRSVEAGFTLIELAVVMVIVGIIAMAALPSFRDFFDRYRLRGAADDVISLVANARAESVKTDRDVRVSFGGSTVNWCVGANAAVEPTGGDPVAGAAACDCTTPAQCLVGGQQMASAQGTHSNVSVASVNTAFTFSSKLGVISPLGSASSTLTSPSGKYDVRVVVDALGHASACVPTGKPDMAGVPSC